MRVVTAEECERIIRWIPFARVAGICHYAPRGATVRLQRRIVPGTIRRCANIESVGPADPWSDRELAARFPDGDERVLRAVYDRFGGAVYAVAYAIVRDQARAADAAQATFVNAWRAAARFDGSHDLAPWLFTIARRAAIDEYRRQRRVVPTDPTDLDGFDALDGVPRGDGVLERAWETWQVRLAVDDLPGDEREVVRLSWFEGLTHPEIASQLDTPVGTVKSRSHRAHRRLARALAHLRDANRAGDGDVRLRQGDEGGMNG
jgi:RNA polymerase sigma-70 factor (ECF subfamily)